MKTFFERLCLRIQTAVRLAVTLVLCIAMSGNAKAQTTFLTPIWGGSIAQSFNSTRGAQPGWYHTGIDYWGPNYQSTYILASNTGIVHAVVFNGSGDHGLGNCVILRHDVVISSNGTTVPYYTLYAHLDSIVNIYQTGQRVSRGQIIGILGSSGYGKAKYWGNTPHLHFEVKTAGVLNNPYNPPGVVGQFWGYTPTSATNYGYIDPAQVIGRWKVR